MSEDTNTPQDMPEESTSAGFTPLRGLLGLLLRCGLGLLWGLICRLGIKSWCRLGIEREGGTTAA